MTPSQTIGFITGGQLGKMMIESFIPLRQSETILVLDSSAMCPCSTVADEVFVGSCKDYDTVLSFGEECDTIILEFEHVNIEALQELEKMGKTVIAQPQYTKIIQNKKLQKEFLQAHNIPTARFTCISGTEEIASQNIEFPVIQKTFLDGYDGGGVQKLSSLADIEKAFDAESLLEECVEIEKEYSLIIGRDMYGTVFQYPLIEQKFHAATNIVDTVWFADDVTENTQKQANEIGEKLITAFGGTGMFAIELFLDNNGTVLVNEIAPRVHNSGHHTLQGAITSQFEQYMRVSLGYAAGDTSPTQPCIMVNILGEEGHTGETQYQGMEELMKHSGVHVHLYGKTSTKPHRKMGHVNVTGKTLEECWEKVEMVKNVFKVVA